MIYDAGIIKGCVPGVSYCPTANVTREEMASFLARTAGLGANKPVTNAARLALTNPTVGGATYAANELTRVTRAAGAGTNLALTYPGNGLVVVTGAGTVTYPGGGHGRVPPARHHRDRRRDLPGADRHDPYSRRRQFLQVGHTHLAVR